MSKRFSFGNGVLRAAVSLGFFGYLAVQGFFLSQTATSQSLIAFYAKSIDQSDPLSFHCSDSRLTEQAKIGLPDEFGVALEDDESIEIIRVDVRRRPFGSDRAENGPKVCSAGARIARQDISPPLLL